MTSIDRRNLLKALPAAAIGAGLAGATVSTDASASAPSNDSAVGKYSAVTYIPVPAQKQLVANAQAVKSKAYSKHFEPKMIVPTDRAIALQSGPLDKVDCLSPSVRDINRLFDPGYKTPAQGYAVLDGSTTYVQSRLFLQGVTTKMFRWWMSWHQGEDERYMLWFPHAHVKNSVEDKARLADTRLSFEDRIHDNPNHVTEWIGSMPVDIIMHFSDPVKLGLDPKAMAQAGFTASASAIVSPAQAPDVVNSLMLHLGRDVEGGMELVSRFWIGGHPELSRFPGGEKAPMAMKFAGLNDSVAEMMAYEMSVHVMTEFTHLAGFLPALYNEFGEG